MPATSSTMKTVSIGTDCSGMETPIQALLNLGVPLDHQFSCDINSNCKKTIYANYPPEVWYDDLVSRDNKKAPKVDVYVAGFPCQTFSSAGKQKGFQDPRGKVFFGVLDYLRTKSPTVFVLENVKGLVRNFGGQWFEAIMKDLESLKLYNISYQIMNTKDHGIPQNRERVYIVGIKKSADRGTFDFPSPVPCPSIETFLDPRKKRPSDSDFLERNQTTTRNVPLCLQRIRALGKDPLKAPYVADIDSSTDRMKFMYDIMPCMTVSRNKGHFLTNRMRRANLSEMARLQGVNPHCFKQVISANQLGMQIGNAMSVNVLERLFTRILPAAGLVPEGVLVDRFGPGKKTPVELTAAGAASTKRRAMEPFGVAGASKKRARVA